VQLPTNVNSAFVAIATSQCGYSTLRHLLLFTALPKGKPSPFSAQQSTCLRNAKGAVTASIILPLHASVATSVDTGGKVRRFQARFVN